MRLVHTLLRAIPRAADPDTVQVSLPRMPLEYIDEKLRDLSTMPVTPEVADERRRLAQEIENAETAVALMAVTAYRETKHHGGTTK